MRVGSSVPLAPRRVAVGMPRTEHGLWEVFFTVSEYAICPAPADPGISANVPPRSVPSHGLAPATDPVVTVLVDVTVRVFVIVTVLVPLPRQPAAVSPMVARTSPAAARRPTRRGRRR